MRKTPPFTGISLMFLLLFSPVFYWCFHRKYKIHLICKHTFIMDNVRSSDVPQNNFDFI